MRTRRAAVLLTALAVGPAVIVGCGGNDAPSADSAQALLKDTFGPGHPITSGRLALTLRISGEGGGLGDPIAVDLAGPFVSAGGERLPRFAVQLKVGGGDQVAAGLVSTGKQGFVTVGRQAFLLTDDAYRQLQERYQRTQRRDAQRRADAPGLSALGVRPAAWLTDASTTDDADVGGTPTTRVSGALNVDALLSDVDRLLGQAGSLPSTQATGNLPERLTPAVREALNRSVTTAKITVDAGKSDRTLRRITLRLILDVAPEDQKALDGLKKLDVDLDLAITELGKVRAIQAPKNARPFSDLGKALSGITPRAAEPAPSGKDPGASYTECLQQAGSDVGAIQQCADLLNRGR